MYAGERDVQKVLYTAQNVRWRVRCAKSALYSTKCTLERERERCVKSALYSTICTLESEMYENCHIQHKMYTVVCCTQTAVYSTKCTLEGA